MKTGISSFRCTLAGAKVEIQFQDVGNMEKVAKIGSFIPNWVF